ncbi:Uncharacterised protein [Serratia quinivorans]|uniref:Uncharacterized protein n=1 Tax=Serratia quinivorans TaxID=137545 RepID=A0A379YDQ7_9GAMM|nr:Uncharacterised protein [Serratia quinivorans]
MFHGFLLFGIRLITVISFLVLSAVVAIAILVWYALRLVGFTIPNRGGCLAKVEELIQKSMEMLNLKKQILVRCSNPHSWGLFCYGHKRRIYAYRKYVG